MVSSPVISNFGSPVNQHELLATIVNSLENRFTTAIEAVQQFRNGLATPLCNISELSFGAGARERTPLVTNPVPNWSSRKARASPPLGARARIIHVDDSTDRNSRLGSRDSTAARHKKERARAPAAPFCLGPSPR